MSFIPAFIWLGVGFFEIAGYSLTLYATAELLAYTALGFIAIIGLGLAAQWLADYITDQQE